MVKTLTAAQLSLNHADPRKVLESVCGIKPWSDEQARRYMAEQYARQRVGLLYRYFGEYAHVAQVVVFLGGLFAWSTAVSMFIPRTLAMEAGSLIFASGIPLSGLLSWLLLGKKRRPWQTNALQGGIYWRDWKATELPAPIDQTVQSIRQVFPQATFQVSFLGADPILWVKCDPDRAPIAAVVWDEPRGKEIAILPPPR